MAAKQKEEKALSHPTRKHTTARNSVTSRDGSRAVVTRSLRRVEHLNTEMRHDQNEIDQLKSETRRILRKLNTV